MLSPRGFGISFIINKAEAQLYLSVVTAITALMAFCSVLNAQKIFVDRWFPFLGALIQWLPHVIVGHCPNLPPSKVTWLANKSRSKLPSPRGRLIKSESECFISLAKFHLSDQRLPSRWDFFPEHFNALGFRLLDKMICGKRSCPDTKPVCLCSSWLG